MKKAHRFIGCSILVILFLIIVGALFGINYQTKNLPVVHSSALYPSMNLASLCSESSIVFRGRVEEVRSTVMKDIQVSVTEDASDVSDTITSPETPVILSVEELYKGDSARDSYTYIEEGGTTSTHVVLPSFQLRKGMEVILFLNDAGYGWGMQSIFPIVDGQVILNEAVWNDVDMSKIQEVAVSSLTSKTVRASYETNLVTDVKVMDEESFVSVIRERLNN